MVVIYKGYIVMGDRDNDRPPPPHLNPQTKPKPNQQHNAQIQAGRPFPCLYRVRYRQPLAPCVVTPDPDAPATHLRVEFGDAAPQRAVAVQQTLALYDQQTGDGVRCLGGGEIAGVGPSYWEMGKALPGDRVDWAVS